MENHFAEPGRWAFTHGEQQAAWLAQSRCSVHSPTSVPSPQFKPAVGISHQAGRQSTELPPHPITELMVWESICPAAHPMACLPAPPVALSLDALNPKSPFPLQLPLKYPHLATYNILSSLRMPLLGGTRQVDIGAWGILLVVLSHPDPGSMDGLEVVVWPGLQCSDHQTCPACSGVSRIP